MTKTYSFIFNLQNQNSTHFLLRHGRTVSQAGRTAEQSERERECILPAVVLPNQTKFSTAQIGTEQQYEQSGVAQQNYFRFHLFN